MTIKIILPFFTLFISLLIPFIISAQMGTNNDYSKINVIKEKTPNRYYHGELYLPKVDTTSQRYIEIYWPITGTCKENKPYGYAENDSIEIIELIKELQKKYPDQKGSMVTYEYSIMLNVTKPETLVSLYFPCNKTYIEFIVNKNDYGGILVGEIDLQTEQNSKNNIFFTYYSRKYVWRYHHNFITILWNKIWKR